MWFDLNQIIPKLQSVGLTILRALIVFFLGMIVIKYVVKLLLKLLRFRNVDEGLHKFVVSVVRITLLVLLVLSCATVVGLNITPFITAIGAVGLAVSLSIKDSLANLAGGVFILLTKPFKSGDYVALKDAEGTVEEINLLHTVLNTADKKRVYVPNGDVATATITNYSAEPLRRLDINFFVAHGTDIGKVRSVLLSALKDDEKICLEPEPLVFVSGYTENSVNMLCRVWVNNEDYWPLNFALNERVRNLLDDNGFNAPAARVSFINADGVGANGGFKQ